MANALLLIILVGQFIHVSSEMETFFTADSDCMLSQRLMRSIVEMIIFTACLILAFKYYLAAN